MPKSTPKKANRTAAKPKPKPKPAATRRVKPAAATPDWRPAALDRIRSLIRQVLPDATEEIKWRKPSNAMQGVPVWSLGGIICTGETHKDYIKLTFAKGASLPDPGRLFNADDKGNTRRAINIREGDTLNAAAFKSLLRAAAAHNAEQRPKPKSKTGRSNS